MPVPKNIIIERITKVPKAFAVAFSKVNAALKVLEAIANMDGKGGVKITKSETNWVIEFIAADANLPVEDHPFKVVDATDHSGAKVKITPGTVLNFLLMVPTIGGSPMTDLPRPALATSADDFIVYIKVTTDDDGHGTGAEILSAAYDTETGEGLPESDDTYGYVALALGLHTGGVLRIEQLVSFSLGHQKCGSVTHNFWGM